MITIKSVHIRNFRSIVDETINLTDFNCFVGKNDSGKSNVLKALNLFFNGETDFNTAFDFESDYSQFAKRGQKQAKEISIELEILIPPTFIEHGLKVWKKTWRKDGLNSNNIEKLFKPASRGITWLQRICYEYVPAVKSNDYFKNLLGRLYESMNEAVNSALKDLNDEYSHQLGSLTSELALQLRSILGIKSSIQMPSNLSTLFRDMSFSTSDEFAQGIDLNHRGDGVKARHIPSILRYLQSNIEKGRPKRSVGGAYIWGFEEPENGVEYLACFDMAQEFLSYQSECQIFVTTHSPAFYTQTKSESTSCFLVDRKAGISKYYLNSKQINETMGLMQLVAPFIQAAKDEYIKNDKQSYHNLNEQLRKVMNIMQRSDSKLNVKQVLSVMEQFSLALDMLDAYDHDSLKKPDGDEDTYILNYDECKKLISEMKFSSENTLFGNEKDDSFKGSIGNIYQSFDGKDIYPSVQEKAANLLYFITKNHSFSDGNKRIAAAIFLFFLERNNLLFDENGEKVITDHTLVAITVMIAESNPDEKETMIKLIMNFLQH